MTALCKGSQSFKTTLGHQISETYRSHLAFCHKPLRVEGLTFETPLNKNYI